MKQWWLSRTPQDRSTITFGAAALLLLLLYLLVWTPFSQKIEQKRMLVSGQKTTLNWMRERAVEVRMLKAIQAPAISSSQEALLTLVDKTAKQNRLRQQIQRLKPEGNDSVQLWMEQAPFDALIKWLGNLSVQYGVTVESLNIERLETPGQVNARLNLHREPS